MTALLCAAPGRAQVSVSTDATAASVHYDGFLRSGVVLLTPMARIDRPRFSITGRGTFSFFESGNRAADVVLAGSAYTPAWERWQGELTADAGVSRYLNNRTGYGGIGARLHHSGPRAGFWLGTSGTSVTGGTGAIRSFRGDGGAWLRHGTFAASISAIGTTIRDIDYLDGGLHMRWSRELLELSATAGARTGDETGGARAWGDVTATAWITRNIAIVAGHGAYPADITQLSPGGRYTALSIRLATRPPALRDALARSVRYPTSPLVRPVVATFDVRPNGDGTVRLRVRAPGAAEVDIAGDFTDWEAVSLVRGRGDSWEIVLPLARGTHRVNIRVNGGEWGVPPGIGAAPDDFGGVVGLLVISG